jgi:predicted oxidoreductase
MDHHETGAALDGLVRSGKVLNVGVSNFKPHDWQLLQSAMSEKLVTNQIEISVIANQAFTDGDIAFLQGAGIAPMAWSPLAGGALFDGTRPELVEPLNRIANAQGTDIAAIAIAWLLAHPANILPVLGTNNLNRVKALADALNCEIDRQTWFEIYTAATGQEVP